MTPGSLYTLEVSRHELRQIDRSVGAVRFTKASAGLSKKNKRFRNRRGKSILMFQGINKTYSKDPNAKENIAWYLRDADYFGIIKRYPDISISKVWNLDRKSISQQCIDISINSEDDIAFLVSGTSVALLTGNIIKPNNSLLGDEKVDAVKQRKEGKEVEKVNEDIKHPIANEIKPVPDNITSSNNIRFSDYEILDQEGSSLNTPSTSSDNEEYELNTKLLPKAQVETANKKTTKYEYTELSVMIAKSTLTSSVTKKLEGGISYFDKHIGAGLPVQHGDKVDIQYTVKLKTETSMDTSLVVRPLKFEVGANQVIKGLDVGIIGMCVNGKRSVMIRFQMEDEKHSNDPENMLVFEVELIDIENNATVS